MSLQPKSTDKTPCKLLLRKCSQNIIPWKPHFKIFEFQKFYENIILIARTTAHNLLAEKNTEMPALLLKKKTPELKQKKPLLLTPHKSYNGHRVKKNDGRPVSHTFCKNYN